MTDANPDAIPGIYRAHADAFDRQRSRDLMEKPWLDLLLAHLGGERTVLDLGCGMAEPIARYLIDQGCAVTGVDTSPALLDLCRRRYPSHGWLEGDMRAPPVMGRFGAVVAWDSFFFLRPDDQRAMFDVFDRHTADDGLLLFTSGPEAGTAVGDFEGEPLYHASLDPEDYTALLKGRGFSVVRHVAEDPDCGGHTVWLAQRRLEPR